MQSSFGYGGGVVSEQKTKRDGRWGRKKPGAREKKKPEPKYITREKYLTLRKDYVEHQSVAHAARAAGCGYQTAKRYIFEGRPEKNMPPIINFVQRTAKKDESRLEFTLDDFRRKYMKELVEALNGHIIDMRLHNRRISLQAKAANKDENYNPEVDSRMIDNVRGIDLLVRLAERMLGGADETVKVTGDNIVSKMTEQEAIEYLKTAVIPERLR